jgi:DNA-binding Lrp family transcriptional regulator
MFIRILAAKEVMDMAKAYLKIDVEPGQERSIKEELLKIEGVKGADLTSGEQDIIALVEADSYEGILNLVVNSLRPISGIKKTTTNLVLE